MKYLVILLCLGLIGCMPYFNRATEETLCNCLHPKSVHYRLSDDHPCLVEGCGCSIFVIEQWEEPTTDPMFETLPEDTCRSYSLLPSSFATSVSIEK